MFYWWFVSLIGASLAISSCGDLNGDVATITFKGVKTYENCTVINSALTIIPGDRDGGEGGEASLRLAFQNVHWSGGSLIFGARAHTVLSHVHVTVSHSTFTHMNGHVLSFTASSRVFDVSLLVHNTTVETTEGTVASVIGDQTILEDICISGHSSSFMVTGPFMVAVLSLVKTHRGSNDFQWVNVSISAVNSDISVVSEGSPASALSVVWATNGGAVRGASMTGISISSVNSTIDVQANRVGAAMSLVIATINNHNILGLLRNVSIFAEKSIVTVAVLSRVAAVAAVFWNSASSADMHITNLSITAGDSTFVSDAHRAAAALGIVNMGTGGNANLTLVTLASTRSSISSAAIQNPSMASGIGTYGSSIIYVASQQASHVTIVTCASSISSTGEATDTIWRGNYNAGRYANVYIVQVNGSRFVILGSLVQTSADAMAPHGGCATQLMSSALWEQETHAPSVVMDTLLNCTSAGGGVHAAAGALLVNNVTNRTGARDPFPGATENRCAAALAARDACSSQLCTHTVSVAPTATALGTRTHRTSATGSATPTRTVPLLAPTKTPAASSQSSSMTLRASPSVTTSVMVSRSASRSASGAAVHAPPPDPEPAPQQRVRLIMLMPEGAAVAVPVAASTTAVIGGVVSPASASQVARVGGMVRALECVLVQDDPKPSYVEMPLQADVGGGKYATYAGSLLLTTVVLVLVPFVFHAVWWRWQSERTVVLKAAAAVHAVSVEYFVPTALGAATTLLANGDGAEVAVAVACTVSLLGVVAVAVTRLTHTFSAVVVAGSGSGDGAEGVPVFVDREPGDPFVAAMFPFFDGARRVDVRVVRLYAVEDMAVAVAVAVVTGVRRGGCTGVALVVLLLACAHVAYLAYVRPYASRIEWGMSLLGGVTQAALAVLVAAARIAGSRPGLDRAIAVLLLLVFVHFFVQTVVLLTHWACLRHRRRVEKLGRFASHAPRATLEVPLVSIGAMPNVGDQDISASNPLALPLR